MKRRSFIDPARCRLCAVCPPQAACPVQAITREEEDEPWWVSGGCIGCGQCTRLCPHQAATLI